MLSRNRQFVRQSKGKLDERGFTLPELVVVVGVIGIVVGAFVLSFIGFKDSFNRTQAKYQFESDIRRARNEAVSAGGRAIVRIASPYRSYSIGIDYYPFSGTNTADKTLFSRTLPDGMTVTSSQPLIFDSRGYLVDSSGSPASSTVRMSSKTEANFFQATVYSTGGIS